MVVEGNNLNFWKVIQCVFEKFCYTCFGVILTFIVVFFFLVRKCVVKDGGRGQQFKVMEGYSVCGSRQLQGDGTSIFLQVSQVILLKFSLYYHGRWLWSLCGIFLLMRSTICFPVFIFYSGVGLHEVCVGFCFLVVCYVFLAVFAFVFVFL